MTQRWPLDSAEPKKNSALSRTVGTVLNKIESIFANSQKIAKSILSVNTGGGFMKKTIHADSDQSGFGH